MTYIYTSQIPNSLFVDIDPLQVIIDSGGSIRTTLEISDVEKFDCNSRSLRL